MLINRTLVSCQLCLDEKPSNSKVVSKPNQTATKKRKRLRVKKAEAKRLKEQREELMRHRRKVVIGEMTDPFLKPIESNFRDL